MRIVFGTEIVQLMLLSICQVFFSSGDCRLSEFYHKMCCSLCVK